jgi:hypothetical protein
MATKTRTVKAWAVLGEWDKGIFWWYDADDLDQFQIYRKRSQANHALRAWRKNGYSDAIVGKVEIRYEVPND